jgi:hypothetical protein
MHLREHSVAPLATTASAHSGAMISPPANVVTRALHGTFKGCGKFRNALRKSSLGTDGCGIFRLFFFENCLASPLH